MTTTPHATPGAATGAPAPSSTTVTPAAAKQPVGTGSAPLVAQLLALALVCLGAVGVQHLLVQRDVVSGSSWATAAVDAVDGLQGSSPAVLAVGVVALLLSLYLLVVALRPRPRTELTVVADTGVHLRPKDLRRLVEAATDGVDSITGVEVRASRRRLRVVGRSVADDAHLPEVESALRSAVEPVLASVHRAPRLAVSTRKEEI